MKKLLPLLFLFFVFLEPALAVQIAPCVSDREIIENLSDLRSDIKELKAGHKALEQRFDDMNNYVNKQLYVLQWMFGLFITAAVSLNRDYGAGTLESIEKNKGLRKIKYTTLEKKLGTTKCTKHTKKFY